MKKLLQTNNLSKTYVQTQGFFSRVRTNIHALDNVSFSINQGTTMAVVGESGSGKSTLAKSLVRLVNLDKGSVSFNGIDLLNLEVKKCAKRHSDDFSRPLCLPKPTTKHLTNYGGATSYP
jgi:peptide/nickel transport system ATP-binding protein